MIDSTEILKHFTRFEDNLLISAVSVHCFARKHNNLQLYYIEIALASQQLQHTRCKHGTVSLSNVL